MGQWPECWSLRKRWAVLTKTLLHQKCLEMDGNQITTAANIYYNNLTIDNINNKTRSGRVVKGTLEIQWAQIRPEVGWPYLAICSF